MAPHTGAKHQIIQKYVAAWYPILSRWNGRVVFIDGFAGRGRYNDGSEWSPQIALHTLLDDGHLERMKGLRIPVPLHRKEPRQRSGPDRGAGQVQRLIPEPALQREYRGGQRPALGFGCQ
jgi:hypothetical protein